MGKAFSVSLVTAAGLIVVWELGSIFLGNSQDSPPAVDETSPEPSSLVLPDWSGVWKEDNNTVFDHASIQPPGASVGTPGAREYPPYTDEWELIYQRNLALVTEGRFPDPITPCGIPAGFPRIFNLPDVHEFVVRPEQTWILSENGPNVMRIYTDGRPLMSEDERWPLYTGDSVGQWDGDTLRFKTESLKKEGTILDRTGLVLSDQMTAETSMQKQDDGSILVTMVIEDPIALKESWTVQSRYTRLESGSRVFDYACGENNRNPVMSDGYTVTLGPDGKPLEDVE